MAKVKTKAKKSGIGKLLIGAIVIILLAAIGYGLVNGPHNGNGKNKAVTTATTLAELRAQVDDDYFKRGYTGTNTPAVKDGYIPINKPTTPDKLPDYVYTNAMTLRAYKYALEHPEVMEQMPCYCGCGQHGSVESDSRPHRFLRDCFISYKGTFDSHASVCDVCVGITVKAASAFPDGLKV